MDAARTTLEITLDQGTQILDFTAHMNHSLRLTAVLMMEVHVLESILMVSVCLEIGKTLNTLGLTPKAFAMSMG